MQEIRNRARELMAGQCRVCPVCNGERCAGEVPGMGSRGTGASFRNNVSSLATHRLAMRCIHDVVTPNTRVTLLGRTLQLPVLAAPMGGVSFNMGGLVTEEEYVAALLEGCVARGTLGCTGDGAPEFIFEAALPVLQRLAGAAIPFVKPWETPALTAKLQRAIDHGARVVGVDLDAVGLVTLRKMGRPVVPRPAAALKELIEQTSAKVILKGIMTVDQARLAVDVGAGAIVVSNHGGRVLDHTPGAAEVLPAIADAVGGVVTILADGGVRSGEDVLKMLALGADAVMIGRPFAVAALGGGREGVEHYINQLYTELKAAMVLTATADATQVSRDILC